MTAVNTPASRDFLGVTVDPAQGGKLTSNSFLSLESATSSPISPRFRKSTCGQGQSLCFASAEDVLDYVTRNWRENFVTQDLRTAQMIEVFNKRPFFMLVSIDGPISDRFRRANTFVLFSLYAIRCITLFFAEAIERECLLMLSS